MYDKKEKQEKHAKRGSHVLWNESFTSVDIYLSAYAVTQGPDFGAYSFRGNRR